MKRSALLRGNPSLRQNLPHSSAHRAVVNDARAVGPEENRHARVAGDELGLGMAKLYGIVNGQKEISSSQSRNTRM
jgi:hypothetical protein